MLYIMVHSSGFPSVFKDLLHNCICQFLLRASLLKGVALPEAMPFPGVAYIQGLLDASGYRPITLWSNSGHLWRVISSLDFFIGLADGIESWLLPLPNLIYFPYFPHVLIPKYPINICMLISISDCSLRNPAYHTFSSLDHYSSTQPVLLPCPFFPYVGLVIEVSMSDYL